jgi:hypothetical protein
MQYRQSFVFEMPDPFFTHQDQANISLPCFE